MDDLIKEAKAVFDLCVENESENRQDALDDIRFARLANQWPDKVRQDRERDGRPCLTINKMTAFIRQVVNDARQNRPSINIHPIDSGADLNGQGVGRPRKAYSDRIKCRCGVRHSN